ncbi:putative methyltransferase-domain-containing protein [Lentinula raphanica]|uniref:Methyltransferase-domain-containing protein n=1 Tax=Lentinula raphanica TaxID=153919 RepID=A0AA38PK49_9AGAR|nr:putative methyltransferase-domain-containing protein [Lentinula raphanica]KAJ3978031.1 putative methyltransferase-domain-containing protein [Lentinula raphanica]
MDSELNPEEILNSSLGVLYDYQPITLASSGSTFTYVLNTKNHPNAPSLTVTLRIPDTDAANWSLHASSIWASSQYLVDHLDDLHLQSHHVHATHSQGKVRLLELGAGAGLPGITIAKLHPDILVTVSDYPDEQLIRTLSRNIEINRVDSNCCARAYAWGSNPEVLFSFPDTNQDTSLFDVIIATDTLWNPDLHGLFIESLEKTLRKAPGSRAHLIAGLHTGRYTLQSFLDSISRAGLTIEFLEERECSGEEKRAWDVSRAESEDEKERRKWLLKIVLKWDMV